MSKQLVEDLEKITEIYRDCVIKRGGLSDIGIWRVVAKELSGQQRDVYLRLTRSDPSQKGLEGAAKISRFFNANASDTTQSKIQDIKADPFHALEVLEGEKVTDAIYNFVKAIYFEGLKKHATERPERALHQGQVYANARLSEMLPEKYRPIILTGQKRNEWLDAIRKRFSAKDKAIELSYIEGRQGKIIIGTLAPNDISNRGTASHAKGVAAMEQGPRGVAAQRKNPKPLQGRTPPKINRNGGPD